MQFYSPYLYASNNPIRYIDPSGMYSTEEWKKDNGITDDDLITVYQAPDERDGDPPSEDDPRKDKPSMPTSVGGLWNSIIDSFGWNLDWSKSENAEKIKEGSKQVENVTVVIETVNGVMAFIIPMSSLAEFGATMTSGQAKGQSIGQIAAASGWMLFDMATLGEGSNIKKVSQIHAFAAKFENFYKAGKIDALNKEQGKQLIKVMKDLGVEYKVHRPHGGKNPWKVPHINVGKKHIPVKFD